MAKTSGLILGVTASRNGLSKKQKDWFLNLVIIDRPIVLHHGACVGGDEFCHMVAMMYSRENNIRVVIHPPEDDRLMMDLDPWRNEPFVTILAPKSYLERDRDIVDACNRLVAMPDGPYRPHSGTWYTANYARGKKPLVICAPDGKLSTQTGH
jgi:hypothetical protein